MSKIDHINTDKIIKEISNLNNAEKVFIMETQIKNMAVKSGNFDTKKACFKYLDEKYGKNSLFKKLKK